MYLLSLNILYICALWFSQWYIQLLYIFSHIVVLILVYILKCCTISIILLC